MSCIRLHELCQSWSFLQTSAGTAELQPGEKLGHYLVEALVAGGDRCRDLTTAAAGAIKVPHPEAESDGGFVTRFAREAEICRRLDHRSIVKAVAQASATWLWNGPQGNLSAKR